MTSSPPWKVRHTPGSSRVCVVDGRDYVICQMFGANLDRDADALLIASAPDLLDTLTGARNLLLACAEDTEGTPSCDEFREMVSSIDAVLHRAVSAHDPRPSLSYPSQKSANEKGDNQTEAES